MKTEIRILAVVVSFLMLVTGPLAPLASAQQPPPATEPTAQQPAPPPMAPQDTPQRASREGSAAYEVGAILANFWYVPGKGVLCFLGMSAGAFVLTVSIGSAPRTAAYFAREGCGGRWFLTGDDLRPEADVRAFDWETDATKY